MLYCFGKKVILMNIYEECSKKYDNVLTKLDAYFKVLKNIMFKRAWFNRRTQKVDKSVDQFINNPLQPSWKLWVRTYEKTNKGPPYHQHQRCHPVEKLLTDEMLTLDKANKLVHPKEAAREQKSILRKEITTLVYKERFPELTRRHPQITRNACNVASNPTQGRTVQQRTLQTTCYKCEKHGHFGCNLSFKDNCFGFRRLTWQNQ